MGTYCIAGTIVNIESVHDLNKALEIFYRTESKIKQGITIDFVIYTTGVLNLKRLLLAIFWQLILLPIFIFFPYTLALLSLNLGPLFSDANFYVWYLLPITAGLFGLYLTGRYRSDP